MKEKIARWFKQGLWTEKMVLNAVIAKDFGAALGAAIYFSIGVFAYVGNNFFNIFVYKI